MRNLPKVLSILLASSAVCVAISGFVMTETYKNWAIARRSPLNWNGHTSIQLPLTVQDDGFPSIPVRFMGHDVQALIDSGAEWPLADPIIASMAGVEPHGTALIDGRTHPKATQLEVQIGPTSISLDRVLIVENPSKAPLVLGSEIFLQAIVEMDFDSHRLTLTRKDSFTAPSSDPMIIGTKWSRPTIDLQVNGHQYHICATIDTGFTSGLSLSTDLIEELHLVRDYSMTITNIRVDGTRRQTPGLFPVNDLQIGDQHFFDVPVTESGARYGSCENLLGVAVLSRRRVIFDLDGRRMWLLPKSESE